MASTRVEDNAGVADPRTDRAELQASVRYRANADFALDANFTAPPGVTILFGESGAGKTTLLDCICGLRTPGAGRVAIGSEVLYDTERGINVGVSRRHIGYVFQTLALFPHLTAEQNVAYGLPHLTAEERGQKIAAILESFRITAVRARKPGEISGGERQRVALARALVTEPRALLLDEPLSALDAATKARIMDDLRAWNQAHRIPVLYVTHSRDEVFSLGERVVALENGRVAAQGTPAEVLHAPRTEAMAQLAGFENILDATVTALHPEQGTMACRLGTSQVALEAPLGRVSIGAPVRIGIRAGDILLASASPQGLSARNVIAARVVALAQRDVTVVVRVDCGVELEAHVTPGARRALDLQPGRPVWLVLKTHSCHLLR
ncbi:MAG TPA: molybdenum ABC transporter ATP-binding protein [Terriglobales bacterium]|nr:molybdenum ABC transporter ATP-binding protein [Terriglobales bacterium]